MKAGKYLLLRRASQLGLLALFTIRARFTR